MKLQRQSMRLYVFATTLCLMAFATSLYAATNTPLDCPGVIAVNNGYRLTKNTTCSFSWVDDNNKVFNLGNFTLIGGPDVIIGDNLTIKNGVLQTKGIDWSITSENGTLSDLTIKADSNPRGFFIETGSNITVSNCVFVNIPGIVLDFYYGNFGTVKNSFFMGNGTAISLQKSNFVVIERNSFVNNNIGVNLFDEDDFEVNNNTIRRNVFNENAIGVNMQAEETGLFATTAMNGNQFLDNKIYNSGLSGINIKVSCFLSDPAESPKCPAQNTKVSGNRLVNNGFKSTSGFIDENDDGLTARGTLLELSNGEVPYPQGLAGVTLASNRAEHNADLGFDAYGVTDGGGQKASANGDARQCVGVRCSVQGKESDMALTSAVEAKQSRAKRKISALALQQRRHTKR